MRLTKRQLKRIIREEYSKLKRQGLIRESWHDERVWASDRSDTYGGNVHGRFEAPAPKKSLRRSQARDDQYAENQREASAMVEEWLEANPGREADAYSMWAKFMDDLRR